MKNDDKAICPICKNKLKEIQNCKTKYEICKYDLQITVQVLMFSLDLSLKKKRKKISYYQLSSIEEHYKM
jgi:hypothetical protein